MNNDIRCMYIDAIDLANKYDIPWEAKRLVFEAVLAKVEKQADNAIKSEIGCDIRVDTLIIGGNEDAENVSEDKLGELSERGDAS